MTNVQFVESLSARHENVSQALQDDYFEFSKDHSPENLHAIYEYYRHNWKISRAPYLSELQDMVKDARIKDPRKERFLQQCQECKTIYPYYSHFSGKDRVIIRFCPVCKKLTPIVMIITKTLPPKITYAREDCWQCERYKYDSLGPKCKFFGREGSGEQDECLHCTCRQCCYEADVMRKDPYEWHKIVSDPAYVGFFKLIAKPEEW